MEKTAYQKYLENYIINSEESHKYEYSKFESNHYLKILELQLSDGSFGLFHSMSVSSFKDTIHTEKALRRLYHLGFNKEDEIINKTICYMEKYLLNEIELRDYQEKRHDWKLLTNLFCATWIRRFDKDNKIALEVATKWSKVLQNGFKNDEFNVEDYISAYNEILNPIPGKSIWMIDNFYILSIVSDLLPVEIQEKYLNYLFNNERGVYYLYNKPLNEPPVFPNTKDISRYLEVWEILSNYSCIYNYVHIFNHCVESYIVNSNEYDLTKDAKDNMILPYSSRFNVKTRIIESTILVNNLKYKLSQSKN